MGYQVGLQTYAPNLPTDIIDDTEGRKQRMRKANCAFSKWSFSGRPPLLQQNNKKAWAARFLLNLKLHLIFIAVFLGTPREQILLIWNIVVEI